MYLDDDAMHNKAYWLHSNDITIVYQSTIYNKIGMK